MFFRSGVKKGTGVIGGGVGMAMFLAAAATLGWNEVRTVEQAVAIAEFAGQVKNVAAAPVDPSNSDRAVHLTGQLETDSGVMDEEFAFGGDNLLVIERSVEMYQWYSDKKDNETRYSKKWDDEYQDLSGEHSNPPFPIREAWLVVDDAHIGGFGIDGSQLERLDRDRAIPPELNETLAQQGWVATGDELFLGKGSLSSPAIGDVRVSFEVLKEAELSVIGKQLSGARIGPYLAANGYEVFEAAKGSFTVPQMIRKSEDSNTSTAWILRFAGGGGMALGLGLAFSGWLSLFAWIPILGPLVQRMAFGAGVIIGGVLAAVLFSGAWLYAHPTVFYAGLAVVIIGAIALGMRQRKTALATAGGVPPMPPPVFNSPGPPPPPPR